MSCQRRLASQSAYSPGLSESLRAPATRGLRLVPRTDWKGEAMYAAYVVGVYGDAGGKTGAPLRRAACEGSLQLLNVSLPACRDGSVTVHGARSAK